MPVWNGAAHLREAIDSILIQTFSNFEFIILDDGSTDETPEILREYQRRDPRIRVIPLNHEGIVIALNRGVAEAKAEWIARMDCDDIAHPTRFEKQFEAISNSKVVLCHTHINHIGEIDMIKSSGRFIRTKALLALRLCFHSPIVHPTVMFRRDVFLALGGYLAEERHAEDFGLWGKMLELGEIVGVPEPLLDYRVHGNSISKQQSETQRRLAEKIAKLHCQKFGNLTANQAEDFYSILMSGAQGRGTKDWLVLILRYAPRLRWQSMELWAWLFSRLVKLALSR